MRHSSGKIKFIAAPQGSAEWLALRENGIGGSEIGGVLGQSDYMDPIKVYLSKIGEAESFKGNRFTRMGKIMEDMIAKLYCYWEDGGDADTMLINHEEGKKFRRVEKVNGYVLHEDYPWLYSSLDRKVVGDPRGIGIVETKNTTSTEKNRYTHGFNPSFFCQIQQQLLTSGVDFCDVAIMFDGNNFDVKPVGEDKEVQQLIIEESKVFWGKVLKARAIKQAFGITSYYGLNMDFIPEEKRQGVYMLMQLEPELTGTESEYKFLQTLVKPTPEYTEMPGTEEQLNLVKQYLSYGDNETAAKKAKVAVKEKLVLSLGGYHKAMWSAKEYISYKPKGKSYTFRVSPALDPSANDDNE